MAIDLLEWKYLYTLKSSLDIYGYGCLRVGIDRATGKQRLGYVFNEYSAMGLYELATLAL